MTYCNCNTQKLIVIFACLLIALGVLLATSDVLVIFNGEPTLVSQSVSSDQYCSVYKEQLIRLKAQIYDLQQQLGSTGRQQQDDSRDLPTFSLRSSTHRRKIFLAVLVLGGCSDKPARYASFCTH
jgi:hypothetical protein